MLKITVARRVVHALFVDKSAHLHSSRMKREQQGGSAQGAPILAKGGRWISRKFLSHGAAVSKGPAKASGGKATSILLLRNRKTGRRDTGGRWQSPPIAILEAEL